MYRILRILNRFNLGGPTYNASYLTKYLNDEFETLLIGGRHLSTEVNSLHIPNQLGIQPIIIPYLRRSINPFYDIISTSRIYKYIEAYRPIIVHTHAAKAGALGRIAAYLKSVPIIVHTYHGHVFDAYFSKPISKIFIQIERQIAKITDAIIVLCQQQYNDIVYIYKIAPPEKVHIIPLGLDLQYLRENVEEKRKIFRTKYGLKDHQIAIAIVGRLVPVKNHIMFIDALQRVLRQTTKEIRVFIVGDGHLKDSLQKRLFTYGISYANRESEDTIVRFTSWEKDMDLVYSGVDIVALSSKNEGTPVSLIEALAARKAVVTTLVGGIKDLVKHNINALTSDVDDLETFTKNLLLLIEDDQMRFKFSKNDQKDIFEKFNYIRLIKDIKQLYFSLLEKKVKNLKRD